MIVWEINPLAFDDFTFAFFHQYWSIVKGELMEAIGAFYEP